jgi:hypothetical protein
MKSLNIWIATENSISSFWINFEEKKRKMITVCCHRTLRFQILITDATFEFFIKI